MPSSVPQSHAAPEPLGPEVTRIAIVVLAGTFMSILDTTIVNVALDRLSIDFSTGFEQIQWIVTAYMLAMAAVIPLSGWMAVRFGPKPIFIASAAAFTLASAMCGASWSLGSLVGFRVLQGAAGGLLLPVGQMMLARAAGPHRMGRVMSIVAVPMLIAPVLGPVLGGFLVDDAGWRWIFYVNVPVGIAAVALAMRLLPRNSAGPSWPLDIVGVLLMAVGVPAITYGLAETGIKGTVTATTAWPPIVAGVILTGLYAVYALRRERPLLNVRLFTNTAFSAASITAFALGGALFGGMILLPLYEQGLRGHSAMQTGLLLMPQGMGAAIAAPISGRLTDKVGGGIVAVAGLTVLILATVPFTRLTADTPQWLIMVSLFVRGMGIGGSMMPAFAASYATLKPPQIPDATSQLNVLQRVGGSIGSAVMAVVLANLIGGGGAQQTASGASLPKPVRDHVAHAFAQTHWWVLGFSVVAMVPAVILLRVERRLRLTAAEVPASG